MLTIVGILTFMGMMNSMLGWVLQEKMFNNLEAWFVHLKFSGYGEEIQECS